MARSSTFTPEIGRKLVSLVRGGQSPTGAALMLGIPHETMRRWRNHPDNRAFRAALKKARTMFERRMIARIDNASRDPKHWTAAAWLLERLHPEKYALRVHRAVEAEREAMRAVLRDTLGEEQFAHVAKALVGAQQDARGRGREQRTH